MLLGKVMELLFRLMLMGSMILLILSGCLLVLIGLIF